MSFLKKFKIEITVSLLCCALGIGYGFIIRHYIPAIYKGVAPVWLMNLVHYIYPRFLVEKHRFDITFFIDKADQVCIRFILVVLIMTLLLHLFRNRNTFTHNFQQFWEAQIPVTHFRVLATLFYIGVACYTFDWLPHLLDLQNLRLFYKPILIYKVFGIDLLSTTQTYFFVITFYIALIGTLLNVKPIVFSAITAVLFLFLQGFFYCFEKISHAYVTMGYALILMPFVFWEMVYARKQERKTQNAWALQLIKVCICVVYFLSGLEKLMISKLSWLSPTTFVAYVQFYQQPIGLWFIQYPLLTYLLPVGALFFQLGFALILFFERMKYWALITGVIFHVGTVLLLGVGSFFTPWIFVYIFFIPKIIKEKQPFIQ